MLQSLQEAIREHRNHLIGCLSDCPTPAEIVEFSLGKSPDPSVQSHMECCSGCREELDLIQQLHGEDLSLDRAASPTAEEKLIMKNAVRREYGSALSKPRFSISTWLHSVISTIHIPSLAFGAVAAAILVVVLAPWTAKEIPSRLVLSDAKWESPVPQTMMKGGESLITPKKVALIILVQEGSGLSAEEVRKIYEKLDLAPRLGDQYELISPVDVQKALAGLSKSASHVPDAARLVLEKTNADYVLAFRIGGAGHKVNVAGSLFELSDKRLLGFSSWDGVAEDRLSEKIVLIGTELLSGAEPS